MTIGKGREWGVAVPRPNDLVVAESDRALARLVAERESGSFAVMDGDVHRSLGAGRDREMMQRLPMDLLRVRLDRTDHVAVAHVVARGSWWRGSLLAVMNVDHLRRWNVAPRAHPNDGRFDVVEVSSAMRLRDRLHARSRLGQGTHVPHPEIAMTTATSMFRDFARPRRVWIDGMLAGRAEHLEIEIEPDAYVLHV